MTTVERTPRWLTEPERMGWIGAATLMWQLPGPLDAQLQRDSGLALFEYFVLSQLSMADGRRVRMSELAVLSNSSASRLSNVVGRLEGRGWVTRETDARDRRGTVATLTDAGFAVVVAAAPGHVEAVRRLLVDRLSDDQIAALAAVGDAIRAGVRAEGCTGPAVGSEC